MSNCTPCTPANDELPIFCDPFPATDTAKRLLVEDEAFCQKALNIPTTTNQILKTNASGNIQWGTINSVLQSGPVDLGSQPLTTTGAITASSFTSAEAVFISNSSSDVVRITQTGTGNALKVEDSTNPDATPFVVDANGSVGIGTATPTAKLHVESTGFGAGRALFKSSDAGNYITIYGSNPAGTNDTAFIDFQDGNIANSAFIGLSGQATVQSGDLRFYTGGNIGSVRLIIKKQGNVGIGTSTPTNTLHVAGTAKVDGLTTLGDIAITAASTASTVGGAGGASSLPATPSGYIQISINGTPYKLPYYPV